MLRAILFSWDTVPQLILNNPFWPWPLILNAFCLKFYFISHVDVAEFSFMWNIFLHIWNIKVASFLNTCTPVTDSCWCMAKLIQYCKVKKRNDSWKYSIFDENYKLTDPRSSMNSKHKKNEENYTKAHQNKIPQNQRWIKFLKSSHRKKMHYIQKI